MENPTNGFKRLTLTSVVGLKYANERIKVAKIIKNEAGEVTELICDLTDEPSKMFIHRVSEGAIKCELHLYGDLFSCVDVSAFEGDWKDELSKDSLKVIDNALVEPSLVDVKPHDRYQFERLGYYYCDEDSTAEHIIFNRTLPLTARKE